MRLMRVAFVLMAHNNGVEVLDRNSEEGKGKKKKKKKKQAI